MSRPQQIPIPSSISFFKSRVEMAGTDAPSTSSTAIARAFIDQRAATFHEAFGVESYFNTVMSKYQSKEIS
jgi:hypothetical protein